jgi:hypothetical protein
MMALRPNQHDTGKSVISINTTVTVIIMLDRARGALIEFFRSLDAMQLLASGKKGAFTRISA